MTKPQEVQFGNQPPKNGEVRFGTQPPTEPGESPVVSSPGDHDPSIVGYVPVVAPSDPDDDEQPDEQPDEPTPDDGDTQPADA